MKAKTLRTIILVLLVILIATPVVMYAVFMERLDYLDRVLDQVEARNDSIRQVDSITYQRYALEVKNDREIRDQVEANLRRLLEGKIRAYTELSIQLETLRDSISNSEPPDQIDTLQNGMIRISFPASRREYPGYNISLQPTVFVPKVHGLRPDSVQVSSVIETEFDPIGIDIVLTENKSGIWETTVRSDSPIFNGASSLETFVNPYREGFFDRLFLSGGIGVQSPGGIYASAGIGYKWTRIRVIAGPGVSGLELGGEVKVSSLWPF